MNRKQATLKAIRIARDAVYENLTKLGCSKRLAEKIASETEYAVAGLVKKAGK